MSRIDRIAEPWGERTPYRPGESWPGRVDTFLAPGVQESQVEHWVRSASLLHSDGDAMDIAVSGGRMVGVRGRLGDRVNRGRLGPKDLYGWQANHSRDRLTAPLIRRDGRLVETDWDTAMDRIADHSRQLLHSHGPGSATACCSCPSTTATSTSPTVRPASAAGPAGPPTRPP